MPPKSVYLRTVFTTKRLLQLCLKNKIIATDATYKLNWQGCPLILAGTIDMAKQFHPTALLLSKRETGKDFGFLFKAMQSSIKVIFEVDYIPDTLIADSSGAITNGFTLGFGYKPTWRINCWVHALRAFDKTYSSGLDKENKRKAREDLLKLQTASSPIVFKLMRQLLLSKWNSNKKVLNCFTSFFRVWGKEATQNWYEGYHPAKTVPSQNNALESTNKVIKDDGTLRKRLPCGQFVELMKNKIVKNFSKERNPKQIYNGEFVENVNCKHFYHEPQIELSDWTHAYKKYLLKHDYIRYPSGSNEYFYSSK